MQHCYSVFFGGNKTTKSCKMLVVKCLKVKLITTGVLSRSIEPSKSCLALSNQKKTKIGLSYKILNKQAILR
jgi:hypothetical protein